MEEFIFLTFLLQLLLDNSEKLLVLVNIQHVISLFFLLCIEKILKIFSLFKEIKYSSLSPIIISPLSQRTLYWMLPWQPLPSLHLVSSENFPRLEISSIKKRENLFVMLEQKFSRSLLEIPCDFLMNLGFFFKL